MDSDELEWNCNRCWAIKPNMEICRRNVFFSFTRCFCCHCSMSCVNRQIIIMKTRNECRCLPFAVRRSPFTGKPWLRRVLTKRGFLLIQRWKESDVFVCLRRRCQLSVCLLSNSAVNNNFSARLLTCQCRFNWHERAYEQSLHCELWDVDTEIALPHANTTYIIYSINIA